MRSLLTFAAVAMIALAVGCNGTEEESGTTGSSTKDKTEEKAKDTDTSKTETPAAGEIQQVSLKVPGMT